ncbi:MAG: hypothetical protein HGA31_02020 [Candidatus Moranbacteria bacterium]|nr:hypothetical protein [Candidatus Moranbacteria bacterium]
MKKIFVALMERIFPKQEEYEKFLPGFNRLAETQIRYVIDVINEELEKSRAFGLILTPEDEYEEKKVILVIFDHWGQTLNKRGETYSASEYEKVMGDLSSMARELLENQVKRHFDETPDGEVKTRYNCHLESVMSRLSRDFMEKRCIFYMNYP